MWVGTRRIVNTRVDLCCTVGQLLDSMEEPEQTVFDNQPSLKKIELPLLCNEQFYNDIRELFHPNITYEEVYSVIDKIHSLIDKKKLMEYFLIM